MEETITFQGTRNEFLTVAGLAPYIYGMTFNEIGEVVQQTQPYKSVYAGKVVPEELQEGYYTGQWYETTAVPEVVVIRGSPIDPGTPTLATNTGIVGTVLTAFNSHNNLQFRPDDLWISILAQFSAYINGRAKELRSKIVDHEGQKSLQVTSPGNIYTADLGAMNREFLDQIADNIKDASLREWFLPGFTTTTETDQVCAAAMAMCSFQAYFTYKFGMICGIPQVTLLGSTDDWKLLRQKVERLAEFDGEDKILSEQWLPRLREILDNFVESSKNGSVNNLDFWNQIVSNTGASCGGPELLTGWISTFSVFNDKGELYADMEDFWPVIRLDDIHHNIASCPAQIDEDGVTYNATLFVGQMAYDFQIDQEATDNLPSAVSNIQAQDGYMRKLVPRNDWALAISQGFIEVPPVDPEEPQMPDGTKIYGDQCLLDPYAHSNGSFFDPLTLPDPPVSSSNDSGDTLTSEDSRSNSNLGPTSAAVRHGNTGGVHPAAWIAPLAILGVLGILVWMFMAKSRSKSRSQKAGEFEQTVPSQPKRKISVMSATHCGDNSEVVLHDEEDSCFSEISC